MYLVVERSFFNDFLTICVTATHFISSVNILTLAIMPNDAARRTLAVVLPYMVIANPPPMLTLNPICGAGR